MNRKKLYALLALLLVIFIVTAVVLVKKAHSTQSVAQQQAQQIPSGTYFAQVRKLSAGEKPFCLTEDPALSDVVKEDDKLPYDKSFGSAIANAIPDMPAGFIDVKLNDSTPTSKTGYVVFSDKNQQSVVQDLKTFNFTVNRPNANATWSLKSFIACTDK